MKTTFFKIWQQLNEAGEPGGMPGGPPPPGGGGDPMAAGGMPPPGGDPMGGGGMGGMGGPPGGDPMGGGGASAQPVPVKTIAAADVWGILEKLVGDEKYGKFFDEINISKRPQKAIQKKESPKKSSLL